MAALSSLPDELLLHILNYILQPPLRPRQNVARYATINRVWQQIVEKVTFKRITLWPFEQGSTDVLGFWYAFSRDRYPHRRRLLACLTVEIQFRMFRYPLPEDPPGSEYERAFHEMSKMEIRTPFQHTNHGFEQQLDDDGRRMTMCLFQACHLLKDWTRNEAFPGGITLRLNLSNASYWQQMSSAIRYLDPVGLPSPFREDTLLATIDIRHRDRIIRRAERNFYRLLWLDFSSVSFAMREPQQRLPEVSVVRYVSFGQRSDRTMAPEALRLLITALDFPRVSANGLERWQREVYHRSGHLQLRVPNPDGLMYEERHYYNFAGNPDLVTDNPSDAYQYEDTDGDDDEDDDHDGDKDSLDVKDIAQYRAEESVDVIINSSWPPTTEAVEYIPYN